MKFRIISKYSTVVEHFLLFLILIFNYFIELQFMHYYLYIIIGT